MKNELEHEEEYKGHKIEIYSTSTFAGKFLSPYVDGKPVKKGPNLSVSQAVKNSKEWIDSGKVKMSRFSLADKITQGTEELEREKQQRNGALPPGEKPSENPQDPAQGLPGDESGDPMFNVPTKKTDEQMAAKPEDILNTEAATDMGAPDTIEQAIKRVVVEAIKEAATPEGHVNTQVVDQMGAAKMSRMGIGKYYIDDLVKTTEEQTGLPSGSVVRVRYVGGIYLIVEYKGKEFKVTKDSVVHAN